MSILTQGVDISTLGTSSGITNASGVAGATVTDALNTLLAFSGATPYRWTWADATARLAQAVVAGEIGFRGYQTDLAAGFELLGTAPTRWGFNVGNDVGPLRATWGLNNGGALGPNGINLVLTSGTLAARVATIGTAATQLSRTALVTGAGAGSVVMLRAGAQLFNTGIRSRLQIVLGAVSTNMRWFGGIADGVTATNVNPNTFTNAFGIGRNAQANLQFYHNDASGLCTEIDLGAAFPAATLNTGYELMIYTLNGASWTYNVRNLATGAEVSGVPLTNIPSTVTGTYAPMNYICNNTDAVVVALDLGSLEIWQLTR